MAMDTANSARLLAVLLATITQCSPASGQVLYRCAQPDRPPAWQDRPCTAGAKQAELAFEPAPAAGPPRAHASEGARGVRHQGTGATAPARRPRMPVRRAAAGTSSDACLQAQRAARLRTDMDGRRLSVRTIRTNERRMRDACGPRR